MRKPTKIFAPQAVQGPSPINQIQQHYPGAVEHWDNQRSVEQSFQQQESRTNSLFATLFVYDGSAKTSKDENSLNNCHETGPNCVPHVFDMFANFRKNTVGLTADIDKAFLMVGIQANHRDFLRFL